MTTCPVPAGGANRLPAGTVSPATYRVEELRTVLADAHLGPVRAYDALDNLTHLIVPAGLDGALRPWEFRVWPQGDGSVRIWHEPAQALRQHTRDSPHLYAHVDGPDVAVALLRAHRQHNGTL